MANLLIIYNFEKKNLDSWGFDFFCFFKFFSTQSTSKNGTKIEAKTFFWVAPSNLIWKIAALLPCPEKFFSGLRRLRFGLKTRALSTEGREEKLP